MSGNAAKDANVEWFKSNLAKLLADPLTAGKFAVIHEQSLKSTHDTFAQALQAALESYSADEFIIQEVVAEDSVVNFLRAAS